MTYEEFLEVIKTLAKSQGFYARVLKSIQNITNEVELEDFRQHIEEQNFKDAVDVVMYYEC